MSPYEKRYMGPDGVVEVAIIDPEHPERPRKARWVCPVCDHVNGYKRTRCQRPECQGARVG